MSNASYTVGETRVGRNYQKKPFAKTCITFPETVTAYGHTGQRVLEFSTARSENGTLYTRASVNLHERGSIIPRDVPRISRMGIWRRNDLPQRRLRPGCILQDSERS